MKFRLLIICSLFLFTGHFSYSQYMLAPTVIASSGGYFGNGGYTLSTTVGEMTMVATFETGNYILTQGFQQPDEKMVGVFEYEPGIFDLSVYPNPVYDRLILEFETSFQDNYMVILYNELGQLITMRDLPANLEPGVREEFDMTLYSSGVYFLQVTNRSGTRSQTVKVLKAN